MVDYNQIALFVEVIDAGSLSGAARRLNLSKSNLSRALTSLEKFLGVQLVIRNTRHFKPTEAGVEFYNLCKIPLFNIRSACEKIKIGDGELKGRLIITMAVDFAHTIFPQIAADFAAAHPKIELDIRGEDRRVDLIEEEVDLALRVGNLNDSTLKALKICDISLILVASADYLAQNSKLRSTEQLADHRLIIFNKRNENQIVMVRRGSKKQKIKIKPSINTSNPLISKSLAILGQGIALLPDIICAEELIAGKLVRVLPEFSTEPSPFHFVWPSHAAEAPKIRAFINFTKDTLRHHFAPTHN